MPAMGAGYMQKEKTTKERTSTDTVLFYGYEVRKNGDIVSPKGKKLNPYAFTYPYSHVTLKYEGKVHKINRAVLIWNMFSSTPVNVHKEIVQFRDGDSSNAGYDNLFLLSRKEYYKQYDNTKRKFTEEIREQIYREYMNKEKPTSYRKLSRKYGCSLITIQKIIREKIETKMK